MARNTLPNEATSTSVGRVESEEVDVGKGFHSRINAFQVIAGRWGSISEEPSDHACLHEK